MLHYDDRMKRRYIYATVVLTVLLALGILFGFHRQASAPEPLPSSPALSGQPTETVKPDSLAPKPKSSSVVFNKSIYSTTSPASPWVIVNKSHPLTPLTYVPSNLTTTSSGQYVRADVATALTQLMQSSNRAGHRLYVLSGYRSYTTQVSVYNSYVQSDGQAKADTYSARPGYSEHQTGLAADIGTGACNLAICFGYSEAGKWLATHAYEFGFIIRYPADKTAVTGYQYEPWHVRYVGKALAAELHKKRITTLEEFFGVSGGTRY